MIINRQKLSFKFIKMTYHFFQLMIIIILPNKTYTSLYFYYQSILIIFTQRLKTKNNEDQEIARNIFLNLDGQIFDQKM